MAVLKDTSDRWEGLCKEDPDYLPEGHITANSNWYLERTGGQQLFFFASPDIVEKYLKAKFQFTDDGCLFLRKFPISGKHITMFIDKSEPKDCLQFSYDFTSCIAAPDNPFYNPDTTRKEAVEMLWNDGCLSTNAMLYMLEQGYPA